MKKSTIILLVLAIIGTIVFGAWMTVRTVKDVQFDMNCTQYLKRATDANTVETAKEELSKAISYAEENNLTEGVVSIFLHQPRNDIGYWYRNMIEAYNELENLSEDATSLEKTNALMNLRESLTDEEGSITMPYGISAYPYNALLFWVGLISFLCTVFFWPIFIVEHQYD